MSILDYLRLGSAAIKAHKKRALTVVAIVGILFSTITAGVFILQGVQNIALNEMLAPTGGKVVVMSGVDMRVCDEDCDIPSEIATIKANVEKHSGQIIPATYSQTNDGIFYHLDKEIFNYQPANTEDDVSEIAISLYNLNKLTGKEMSEHGFSSNLTVTDINNLRDENLHKTVTSRSGKKYYIAGILPGGAGAPSLSLAYVGDSHNPLNLLLEQIVLGGSESFIIKPAENSIAEEFPNNERPSGVIEQSNIDTETMGLVFSEFPNLEIAYSYYRDKANYCSEFNRFTGNCGRNYKYQTVAAISDPLTAYENLQAIWKVFKIVAAVLCVIALIIAVSTYVRIIDQDAKIISLYRANGATGMQVRLVYLAYFLLLSCLTILFAIMMGLVLSGVLSLVNQAALQEVFTLGFGEAPINMIWLVGWNNVIWYVIGSMTLAIPATIILCVHQFKHTNLV